ncbi:MAG: RNA polymerase sigma factor RpoE [Gammaproteobacteria bacterium]|nr:RNA polymerase sigma factor RpoE [Gammaproteobacteria bacterium]
MSDADVDLLLVRKVQQGDKAAFDLLVRKYQNRVLGVISQYIRHSGDIHDVAQESFISAYRAIGNFRGESAFYSWLYRIAVNTSKNWIKARGCRPPGSDIDVADAIDYGMEPLTNYDTPDTLIHSHQVAEVIGQVMEEMPQDLRLTITMREVEGMSYQEIAEAIDIPVGTVRSRIFRAREMIDNRIRPLMEGGD